MPVSKASPSLYQEWLIIFIYYELAYFSVASLLINSHKPGQNPEAIVFRQGTPALKRCDPDPDRLTPTATPFSRTVRVVIVRIMVTFHITESQLDCAVNHPLLSVGML